MENKSWRRSLLAFWNWGMDGWVRRDEIGGCEGAALGFGEEVERKRGEFWAQCCE